MRRESYHFPVEARLKEMKRDGWCIQYTFSLIWPPIFNFSDVTASGGRALVKKHGQLCTRGKGTWAD